MEEENNGIPKISDVEMEEILERETQLLLRRLYRAFGPIIGALILDFTDFATFGPIGLYLGFAVGSIVGWWGSSFYRFSIRARYTWAIITGVYCTVPFTECLPLATIISAVARFYETPPEPPFQQSEESIADENGQAGAKSDKNEA